MEKKPTEEKILKGKQVDMHRDFFVRAEKAVQNRFYFEAVFLEYAAIESRLEVILGILGYPCNKELPQSARRGVNISDRVECLRVCRIKNSGLFKKTKLDKNFFTEKGKLRTWITDRNTFVHGLYKNADEYTARKDACRKIADNGLEYARQLYNEASRLNRLRKNHPEMFAEVIRECKNGSCMAINHITDAQEEHHV